MNKVRVYLEKLDGKNGTKLKQIDVEESMGVRLEYQRRDGSSGTITIDGVTDGCLSLSTDDGRLAVYPVSGNTVHVSNIRR